MFRRALIAVGFAVLVAGCGGGGAGSGSGSVGPNAVQLFITDSMDQNDHVWVTIKSVDLVGANGSTNVFSDATGVTVDLKTLRDSSGARFQFLNENNVPSGSYSGAKVVLAKDLTVFPHGAAVGTPMTFDSQYDNGSGDSAISFNFDAPHEVHGNSDKVVVDFDLAHWDETGNIVTVSLKEGGKQGINDPDRHENIHYSGKVTGFAGSAPNFTFTLQHHEGQNGFPVLTNADTSVFESDGQTPDLGDGKNVVVEGYWDPSLGKLVAKSVRVLTAEDEQGEPAQAEGNVTEFSSVTNFVRVTPHEVEGFVPDGTTVEIRFADDVVFVEGDHEVTKDQFFADVAKGDEVEADGSYDSGLSILTAHHVHLHHEDGGDGGGTTGGDTGGSTGGTVTGGGDSGGSTGETGGSTGDVTSGGSTGETGGSTGDVTGGSTGETGTTGGSTGEVTGGSTGETTGGSSSTTGETGGTTGTTGESTTGTTGTTGEVGGTTGQPK